MYFRIADAAQNIVSSSVIGIANHSDCAPVTAGRTRISMPLITSPRVTETINAAFGFIMIWKQYVENMLNGSSMNDIAYVRIIAGAMSSTSDAALFL